MSGDMEIQVREHGAIVVLVLTGKLTVGEDIDLLRSRFQELLEAGNRLFVLDCSTKFKYMDSAGVRAILECNEAAVQRGGVIRVVESPYIDPMPNGPWWWGILDAYHTVDSALTSFEHD
jgi:anti-anti-sigma factor